MITLNKSTNLQSSACLWRSRRGRKKDKCFPRRIQIWYRISRVRRNPNPICFQLLSTLPAEVQIQRYKKWRLLNNSTFLFKLYQRSWKWDKNWSHSFRKRKLIEKCLAKSSRTVSKRWSSSHWGNNLSHLRFGEERLMKFCQKLSGQSKSITTMKLNTLRITSKRRKRNWIKSTIRTRDWLKYINN